MRGGGGYCSGRCAPEHYSFKYREWAFLPSIHRFQDTDTTNTACVLLAGRDVKVWDKCLSLAETTTHNTTF